MSELKGTEVTSIWMDEADKLAEQADMSRYIEKAQREAAYAAEWPDKESTALMNALKDETFKRLGEEAHKIMERRKQMPMNAAPTPTPHGYSHLGGLSGAAMGVAPTPDPRLTAGAMGVGGGSLTDLPTMPMQPMVTQEPRRDPSPMFPPMKPAIFGMLPNGNRFVVSIESETTMSPTDIDGIVSLLKAQQKLLVVANDKAAD